MTTEIIHTRTVHNLFDLMDALVDARIEARVFGITPFEVFTGELRITLEREMLTDGSHVMNVRIVPVPAEPVAVPPKPLPDAVLADLGKYAPGTLGTIRMSDEYRIGKRGASGTGWGPIKEWGWFKTKAEATAILTAYFAASK